MEELVCKICGAPRSLGRRLCLSCDAERKRRIAKEKFIKFGRYNYGISNCKNCGKEIKLFRKNSLHICINCYTKENLVTGHSSANKYIKKPKSSKNLHREIASEVLGRTLSYNEIVHHIDCNEINNDLSNLMLLSRSNHVKLHRYLIKINSINFVKDSFDWLEKNNIEYVVIWADGATGETHAV